MVEEKEEEAKFKLKLTFDHFGFFVLGRKEKLRSFSDVKQATTSNPAAASA